MANIGKNGYSYTGYSEPFVTSVNIASATALNTVDYDGLGAGIVAIENSEFRNAGLYARTYSNGTVSTVKCRDCNFHNRMDESFTDFGQFVITDATESAYVTVDAIDYKAAVYGDVVDYPEADASEKGVYTLTLSAGLEVTPGMALRVVGRKPDFGSTVGGKDWVAGEVVTNVYNPSEVV